MSIGVDATVAEFENEIDQDSLNGRWQLNNEVRSTAAPVGILDGGIFAVSRETEPSEGVRE
jgi:hypothetical protein